jgi:hypothetical protein
MFMSFSAPFCPPGGLLALDSYGLKSLSSDSGFRRVRGWAVEKYVCR